MLAILTTQVLIACYAYFIAQKEAQYLKERIMYVPINSPFDDPFHTYGAWARATVIVFAVVSMHTFWAGALIAASGTIILWVLYDVIVGNEVWDDPYRMGPTSKIDAFLQKTFGKKAGQRKVQVAGVLVVLLNLLYLFL
jgi:hypothetical protein